MNDCTHNFFQTIAFERSLFKQFYMPLALHLQKFVAINFNFSKKTKTFSFDLQILTPTAKVKPQRQTQPSTQLTHLTQFTLTRKKRCYLSTSTSASSPTDFDVAEDDLLCPFGSEDLLWKHSSSDECGNGKDGEKSS